MYQALYRKWRPLVFSDVVGQGHITETLSRQVEAGRLSHAYLFTGTRGTGKTTCAKILARAVNCESPKDGDPCNRCPSCLGILEGSIPDIAEIDAASNSGVDNIRSLREESVYTPVAAKKRVYIIDEVHMLSAGAFNALLKTLEEPPEHVMFILATTETHKVPATILSRCQRFAFRRISRDDIAAKLAAVARAEKLDIMPDAALLLARLADGALRDGLSLLDQCAAQSSGLTIDTALVDEIVGLAGRAKIAELAGFITRNDLTGALAALDGLISAGKEISVILDELSLLLRDALLAHLLPAPRDGTDSDAAALKSAMSREGLIQALLIIQESQSRLPVTFSRRLEVELCLIKLCGDAPAPTAADPGQKPQVVEPEKTEHPPSMSAVPPAEPVRDTAYAPEEVIKPAGERFKRLLGLNEFFKSLIADERAEEQGDRLLLRINDPFILHTLKQDEFIKLAKSVYPGGVEFVSGVSSDETKKRLSDFKARAGELMLET